MQAMPELLLYKCTAAAVAQAAECWCQLATSEAFQKKKFWQHQKLWNR
jgi:hypothetical protein